jgi:glycogen debranching enzyme
MMDDIAGAADLDSGEAVTTGPDQSLSMKDGDTFLVFDPWGDLLGGADGLFSDDTRILSRWRLLVGGHRPSKLSFGLSRDNAVFTFNGANLALPPVGGRATPRGVIHLERKRCLYGGRLYERVRLTNFGLDEVMLPIAFEYGADFRDMFEVRGMRREVRGVLAPPRLTGRGVVFGYDGLDGARRAGAVTFSQPPWRLSAERADFMFAVAPGDQLDLHVEAGSVEGEPPTRERFLQAKSGASRTLRQTRDRGASLMAADGAFNGWLEQSRADVALLTTNLTTGAYPYAGIPWFSTPFGRDGIICAWQMLWLDPSLAKGVLSYLASRQATERSDFADAAPGKIMHETRRGEMAALGEVPFGLYYGGVDTTPLFVALAGAYLKRTGDLALIQGLWPSLLAAVRWLENDADSNGDGLLDYQRAAESGLANQGWKDSLDSVFHDDGRFAAGPVALVEVQGYAFAAWRAMAFMAERLGEPGAAEWAARSDTMQDAVESRFWMEERDFYALAIDGASEVCGPLASNAGHLLFVGLPGPERAAKVTQHLLSPKFDSGWGIRTLAVGAVRFNPMSYHNGSVWPHDTALAVFGMAQYGERAGAAKILSDMFQASKTFDMRMPELLCGFVRKANEPPVAYPVACMPQAWAAGSTFMMLQACLGLTIDALQREVRLVRPTLPDGVDHLSLTGLTVGGATVDIDFQRMGGRIAAIPRLNGGPSIAVVIDG